MITPKTTPARLAKADSVFGEDSHWFSALFEELYADDPQFTAECAKERRSWWGNRVAFIKKYYNYWPLHAAYFIIMSLIGAGLLLAFEPNAAFIDTLFVALSAVTVSSLTTLSVPQMQVSSQVVVWLWMMFGGQLILSCAPMVVRMILYRRALRRHLDKHNMHYYELRHGQEVEIDPVPEAILHSKYALEYRAQKRFFKTVLVYMVIFIVGASLLLGLYATFNESKRALMDANKVQPFWWSTFSVVSGFNSAGFALFDDSFIQFVDDRLVTVTMSIVVIFGQTGAPILLRLFVWGICRYRRWCGQPAASVWKYMLKYPRMSFTHMYDAHQTRVLALLVFATPFFQSVSFLALEWNWSTAGWSVSERFNAAWFQSAATRFSGFACVDMTKTNPANWVLWSAMMYLASYPMHLAFRHVELKAEPAFWIDKPPRVKRRWPKSLQRMARRELCWLLLAVYLIVAFEADRVRDDPHFTLFHIIFEIASGFGTCGLSLGYPGSPVSFSGQLRPASKVVVMIVMFFGRHRDLPDAIDSTISLPEQLEFRVPDGRTVRVRPAGVAPVRRQPAADPEAAIKLDDLSVSTVVDDGDAVETHNAGRPGPARQAAHQTTSDEESVGDVRSRSPSDVDTGLAFDADPEPEFAGHGTHYNPTQSLRGQPSLPFRGTYASPPRGSSARRPSSADRGRRPARPGSPRSPAPARTRDGHLELGTRRGDQPAVEMGEFSLHRYPD
eukprot:TRINITY_DN11322_c0_g1_i1.p1 TRINITY_DN11322_c0_g1~~TRINITY_DN11322_c0_g1_i1.p1  ORF type:complete len:742 (+),score=231.61 TRINITY_DN11322_c0_g1_i1:48-2228(+)